MVHVDKAENLWRAEYGDLTIRAACRATEQATETAIGGRFSVWLRQQWEGNRSTSSVVPLGTFFKQNPSHLKVEGGVKKRIDA